MRYTLHKIDSKVRVILIFFIFLVVGLVIGLVCEKQKSKTTMQEVYNEPNLISQINAEDLEAEFGDTFRGEDEIEIVALEDIEQEEAQDEKTASQATESSNIQNTGNTTYFIRINKLANVVTIFKKDENGEYTVPVKAMTCSTGTYTPAVAKYPNTKYKITGYKSKWARLQGNVYGQYATQIVGNILFHSVPYTEKNSSSVESSETADEKQLIKSKESNRNKNKKALLGKPVRRENPNRTDIQPVSSGIESQKETNVQGNAAASSNISKNNWADALERAIQAIEQDK